MEKRRVKGGRGNRQSIRIPSRGYENMIDTEFEGAGVSPGLAVMHVTRRFDTKIVVKNDDEEDGEHDPVFAGKFRSGDAYLILVTVKKTAEEMKSGGSMFRWLVYVWRGSKVSFMDAGLAGTKATTLQRMLVSNGVHTDCEVVNLSQGEEPQAFLDLFGGEIHVSDGKREAKQGQGDRMTRIKSYVGGQIVPKLFLITDGKLKRIPIREDVIREDCNYILDIGTHVYSYGGATCGHVERAFADELARRRCKADYRSRVQATHVDIGDGNQKSEFLQALRDNEQPEWADWAPEITLVPVLYHFIKEENEDGVTTPTLKVVDEEALMQREGDEILYSIELLRGITVLDCISEVYVWSETKASMKERKQAQALAKEMIELTSSRRPSFVSVEVVRHLMEPVYFKERFFGFDDSDLLEIHGALGRDDIAPTPEERDAAPDAPKQRKLSEEMTRITQFFEEEEQGPVDGLEDMTKDMLELAEDESGTLTCFEVLGDGKHNEVAPDQIGVLSSGSMYVFLYSCKNFSRHILYTWEGKQASIASRTAAGITNAAADVPGLHDGKQLTGVMSQIYLQQGREPRLLRKILDMRGLPLIIYRGPDGGGMLRRKSGTGPSSRNEVHWGYLDDANCRIHAFEVSCIGRPEDEPCSRVTEVSFATLQSNGLYAGHSYVFLRGRLSIDDTSDATPARPDPFKDTGIFYYHGEKSDERNREMVETICRNPDVLNAYGMEFGKLVADLESLPAQVWSFLEMNKDPVTNHLDAPMTRRPRLLEVSYERKQVGGMFIEDMNDGIFTQDDLDRQKTFILDTGRDTVFVWYGDDSHRNKAEHLELATDSGIWYAIYVAKVPGDEEHIRLVDCGHEPSSFKAYFAGWKNFNNIQPGAGKFAGVMYTARFEFALERAKMEREERLGLEKGEEEAWMRKVHEKEERLKKIQKSSRFSRVRTAGRRGRLVRSERGGGGYVQADAAGKVYSVLERLGDKVTVDEDQSLVISKVGRPLKIRQTDITVDQVVEQVRKGGSECDWALYTYENPSTLIYVGHGQGGVSKMLEHIVPEKKVYYGMLKINYEGIDRLIFVVYMPDMLTPKLRAAVSAHKQVIREVLGPFLDEIIVTEKDELDSQVVESLAAKGQM